MNQHSSLRRSFPVFARVLLTASALAVAGPTGFAGTWTPLAHAAPGAVNLMLLQPDGTVMGAQNDGFTIGKAWFKLTPDSTGSYVNGTWSTLASMHDTRLYYPAEVLRDGRVFVAGGEYGSGGPKAEIYDPITNVWTQLNIPGTLWTPGPNNFYDCNSEVLSNGDVLVMPVFPHVSGVPLRYDSVNDRWHNAGPLLNATFQDEASWVKLADDSILTIDPFGTLSERYIPTLNSWVNDGIVPVPMYDPFGSEMGGALLLPDGRAFYLGATGHTAIYTGTGTVSPGSWIAGPNIPAGKATPDAPAAMMVTGNILCAVSPAPTSGNHFPTPITFYEYDPVANGFIAENAPNGASDPLSSYQADMLDLPDGTVLYSHFNTDLYVYTPSGAPLAAGKPVIASITENVNGTYHLVGTGLNGLSEGASYGDDLQMNSNYPLVRLTSGGVVTYARTFNWSSTGVQTGATPVSTEFRVPDALPFGSYSLVVVGNGFASDPVPFTHAPPPIGTWTDLGSGLAGAGGVPVLAGTGTQIPGQSAEIDLTLANASSPAVMLVGLTNAPTAFKGGTLIPIPELVALPFTTSMSGGVAIPFTWPDGLPTATNIYYQYMVADAGAVQGVALSNALQSTSP